MARNSETPRQPWFELRDVRRRKFDGSVWIPLRASHTKNTVGTRGYLGFVEEFFGAGSLLVFGKHRHDAEKLGWMDVGISHEHRGFVQDGRYTPSDTFETAGTCIGIHAVLVHRLSRDETKEWHLHQDLVLTLGLKREGDTSLSADEGYIPVARLQRGNEDQPILLEFRADHLKDYLCAREMALYVTSYWSRQIVAADASYIKWKESPATETDKGDRWEGRVTAIAEGGSPYGSETAVFHVSRTDVDPEEDVPSFGLPVGATESRSWKVKHEGQKLYRIEGELWRSEWVEPGAHSTRVRGDEAPPSAFFIVDATGHQENKTTLTSRARWLWFRPEVMMSLAHRRGGKLFWHTSETGSVRCSPDYSVRFGINQLGLINVYAKDIALLPDWQQRIWAGHNLGPEGGVSEELLASQMKAVPADTQAPEAFLERSLLRLRENARKGFGIEIIRDHKDHAKLLLETHRFRAVNENGFFTLAKDLARLTADSFDAAAMQHVVKPPKGKRWGSLKSLQNLFACHIGDASARELIAPLVGINELRHPDAHLPSSDLTEAYQLARVDREQPLIFQGRDLLHAGVGFAVGARRRARGVDQDSFQVRIAHPLTPPQNHHNLK